MSWFTPTHTHRHRQSTQKGFLLFFIFDYCAIYQLTFYKFQSPAQIIQIIRLSLLFNALVFS